MNSFGLIIIISMSPTFLRNVSYISKIDFGQFFISRLSNTNDFGSILQTGFQKMIQCKVFVGHDLFKKIKSY